MQQEQLLKGKPVLTQGGILQRPPKPVGEWLAGIAGYSPLSQGPFELIKFRVQPGPRYVLSVAWTLPALAAPPPENNLIKQKDQNRYERPKEILAQMRLAPAEFGELESDPGPQILDRKSVV